MHLRHEVAQKTTAMRTWKQRIDTASAYYFDMEKDWLLKWTPGVYNDDTTKFIKNLKDYIHDAESFTENVAIRLNASRYLDGPPEPQKIHFWPYKEFLYRWSILFYKECEKNGLKFEFPREVSRYDQTRPMMYGDPLQIEQIAYNLSLNAIKYALPNTRITFDCFLNENKDKYILEVTNYSKPIPKEEEKLIFRYQYRVSNNLEKDGDGLGLYFAHLIAEKHNGKLELTSNDEICKYNVPLMLEYKHLKPKYINLEKEKEIDTLLSSLRKDGKINQVLGSEVSRGNFKDLYIAAKIDEPTAKITFTLELPHIKYKED
jgi:signal transduction histidine kinase